MGLLRALALSSCLAACTAQVYDGGVPMPGTGPGPSGPADDPNGEGGNPGGSSMLTPSQYITQLAMTQCDELFQCRPQFPGTAMDFVTYYGSVTTECYARAIEALQPSLLEAEVEKQRIVYNGAAAASCIGGFGPPDCSTFWTHDWLWTEPCYHVFAGTVSDGNACVVDYDCVSQGSGCDPAVQRCAPFPP